MIATEPPPPRKDERYRSSFFCGADGRSGRCEGSPVRRTEAAVEEIGEKDGKFGRKVYLCVAKRPAGCRFRRRKWIRYRF